MENPVFARNLEAARTAITFRAEGHEAVDAVLGPDGQVVESQHQFIAVALHRLVYRRRGGQPRHPVIVRQGEERQPLPHFALARRMDAGRVAQVGRGGDPRVRDFGQRTVLRLDHQRQRTQCVALVAVRRQLRIVERHLPVAPGFPPEFDERDLQRLVIVPVLAVRLALVPDEPFGRIAADGQDHSVVEPLGNAVVVGSRLGNGVVDARRRVDGVDGHPRLDGRTAPVGGDEPDRNAQRLVEHTPEKIAHGAELADGGGRRGLPGRIAIVQGRLGRDPGDGEHPNAGVHARIGDGIDRPLDGLEHESAHRHLHVGLSRADPHFAQHHVVKHDLLAVADGHGIGASGFARGDFHRPPALSVGLGVVRATVPRGGEQHPAAGRCLAPEIHFRIALQHHIASEQSRKFHFGFRLHSQQQDHCG